MLVSLVLGKLSVVFGGPRLVATHNIYDEAQEGFFATCDLGSF